MDREQAIERIARWLRPFTLRDVEGTSGIKPWDECSQKTKEYWLNEASKVLTFLESLGCRPLMKFKVLSDEEIDGIGIKFENTTMMNEYMFQVKKATAQVQCDSDQKQAEGQVNDLSEKE